MLVSRLLLVFSATSQAWPAKIILDLRALNLCVQHSHVKGTCACICLRLARARRAHWDSLSVFRRLAPVGGEISPVIILELLAPYLLMFALAIIGAAAVLLRGRSGRSEISSMPKS